MSGFALHTHYSLLILKRINIDDSSLHSGGYQFKTRYFQIIINIEHVLGLKWQYEQW